MLYRKDGEDDSRNTNTSVYRRFLAMAAAVMILAAVVLTGGASSLRLDDFKEVEKADLAAAVYSKTLTKGMLNSIFQSDSYWKMSTYSYETNSPKIRDYYMRLAETCYYVEIINAAADDRQFEKFSWTYDDANGVLNIHALDDGWANNYFVFKNGKFVCEGAYYRTELTQTSTAKKDFERVDNAFRSKYGGYNPAKRLVNSNSHFRYSDISEWDTLPYETFRYLVNYKSSGVVCEADAVTFNNVRSEISAVLGSTMSRTMNMNRVLFGAQLPDTDVGTMNYSDAADVVNLVYTDTDRSYDAFAQLMSDGDRLLSGSVTGQNITANDLYEAALYWNDRQAVAAVRFGLSVLIFRGPKQDIKTMTEYLHLADYIWY